MSTRSTRQSTRPTPNARYGDPSKVRPTKLALTYRKRRKAPAFSSRCHSVATALPQRLRTQCDAMRCDAMRCSGGPCCGTARRGRTVRTLPECAAVCCAVCACTTVRLCLQRTATVAHREFASRALVYYGEARPATPLSYWNRAGSPLKYSAMGSSTERWPRRSTASADFYDTDTGTKKSLSHTINGELQLQL
jgi:hypothetical protein